MKKLYLFSLVFALIFTCCQNNSNYRHSGDIKPVSKSRLIAKEKGTYVGMCDSKNIYLYASDATSTQPLQAYDAPVGSEYATGHEITVENWDWRDVIQVCAYPEESNIPIPLVSYSRDDKKECELFILNQKISDQYIKSVNIHDLKIIGSCNLTIVVLDILRKYNDHYYLSRYPFSFDCKHNSLFDGGNKFIGESDDYIVFEDHATILKENGDDTFYRWFNKQGTYQGWTIFPNNSIFYYNDPKTIQKEYYSDWVPNGELMEPLRRQNGEGFYEKRYLESNFFSAAIDHFENGRRSATYYFKDNAPDIRFWDKKRSDYIEIFDYTAKGYICGSRIYTRDDDDLYIHVTYESNGKISSLHGIRKKGTGYIDDVVYDVQENFSLFGSNSWDIATVNMYGERIIVKRSNSFQKTYDFLLEELYSISTKHGKSYDKVKTIFKYYCDEIGQETNGNGTENDGLTLYLGKINDKYKFHMYLDFAEEKGYMYYDSQGPEKRIDLEFKECEKTGSHTISIILIERGENGEQYGQYDGMIDGVYSFSGTYINPSGKEMPFSATFSE